MYLIMSKTATICLNMIVKNESHSIEKTLSNLCDKITFSYWVICDTGSTDNTPELIKTFFKNKNIPGQLFYDKWVNFAHNRTLALEKAFNKTDLLLVFDADDELCGEITMPTVSNYDEYHIKFGSSAGTNYTRVLLINNKKRFQYLSVIHEYIMCKEQGSTSTVVDGNYYVVSGRNGNRNKDPDKYLKDAININNVNNIKFIYSYGYIENILYDYGLGLKEKYNIEMSNNIEFIIQSKPSTIFFIWTCALTNKIFDTIKQLLPECEIYFLNLEPINLHKTIDYIKRLYITYNMTIYDYSLSNVTLLNENGITNVELLPYINTKAETQYLTHLYNNVVKEYDFGVITGCGSLNNSIELLPLKRRKVFDYLVSNGFTVNRICGYKEHRDIELAKCKIILNIHGQIQENNVWYYSNIFEHLRCDRLLNAGFTILSEDSYKLDADFITKFPNLKQIKYDDFFILNTYTELLSNK